MTRGRAIQVRMLRATFNGGRAMGKVNAPYLLPATSRGAIVRQVPGTRLELARRVQPRAPSRLLYFKGSI